MLSIRDKVSEQFAVEFMLLAKGLSLAVISVHLMPNCAARVNSIDHK